MMSQEHRNVISRGLYNYIVLGRYKSYFVKQTHPDSAKTKFSETDIIKMLAFLIDNSLLMLGVRVFKRQSAYLWVQTAPLPVDLLLCSYEVNFIQGILKKNKAMLARFFNIRFRYTDDVLSVNNYKFSNYVVRIYHIQLSIKDTTDTGMLHTLTYTSRLTVRLG